MKRLTELLQLITITFIIYSCGGKNTYDSYRGNFSDNVKIYDSLVRYIARTYINVWDRRHLSRKVILQCNGRMIFDSLDNRFCDQVLEPTMKDLNINAIYIEKNICYGTRNFDLISFELLSKLNESVYFHYSLCDSIVDNRFENESVVVIPLKDKWSLFVEKN